MMLARTTASPKGLVAWSTNVRGQGQIVYAPLDGLLPLEPCARLSLGPPPNHASKGAGL